MKLLLTSSGITNKSISNALIDLLGKPIAESNALFVPTGVYPYPYGARYAWQPIGGQFQNMLCDLGWKSMGLLELTALPSIKREAWLPALQEADALLVWGGDPLYISYWLEHSGLKEILPSLLEKMVYVGVSAGSIATSTLFGESYSAPRNGSGVPLSSETIKFTNAEGEFISTFIKANGAGLVEFGIIPHFKHKDHQDASEENAEKWASMLNGPVYAIDDQSAIKVRDDVIEIVSEGEWKLFNG